MRLFGEETEDPSTASHSLLQGRNKCRQVDQALLLS